jgi:hypothetical protein
MLVGQLIAPRLVNARKIDAEETAGAVTNACAAGNA